MPKSNLYQTTEYDYELLKKQHKEGLISDKEFNEKQDKLKNVALEEGKYSQRVLAYKLKRDPKEVIISNASCKCKELFENKDLINSCICGAEIESGLKSEKSINCNIKKIKEKK